MDNPPAVAGANNVGASTSENVQTKSLKDIVKEATGREYNSDEEAFNGVKETYSFVGKKVDPVEKIVEKPVVPQDLLDKVDKLTKANKEISFYADHPELKAHKDLISRFGDPEQAFNDPVVKKTIDTLNAHSQAESQRSVLNSNRIAVPPGDDYERDLAALREQKMSLIEFMTKHKGLEVPK